MKNNENTEYDVYTFTLKQHDGTLISVRGNKLKMYEVLEDFKTFLRAATYSEDLIDKITYE